MKIMPYSRAPRATLSLSALLVGSLALAFAATGRSQVPPGYTLNFDDEFNGSAVNTSVWSYRTDAKDLSQQLAANVSESGGYLHIAVKQQTYGSYNYTGGGVISLAGYGYGYYEARVKVPPGSGWHSSFWSMAYNGVDTGTQYADQEVDYMEQDSGNVTLYASNYHYWPTGYTTGSNVTAPNMNSNFNTIGCLYGPYGTTYYLNGKQVWALNTSSYASNAANIWLTSIATTTPDTTKLPSEMTVDWVHYYAPSSAGNAPAMPNNVSAAPSSNAVALSWAAPFGASTYKVKRSQTSGGPYTTIASGITATSYTDSGLSAGTYYYVVSADTSTGVESANSAQVSAVPGTVIVDDASTTGITKVGTWTSSTYNSGYYATDYLHDGDAQTGKSVTFTPSLSSTGTYAVYARWTAGANRASNTPIDIHDGTGTTTTVVVNQQLNNGTWMLLGTFSFNAGTSGYAKIRDDGANGYVIADAIEWVPQ